MKLTQVEFIHAVTIPGTDVLGAVTISPEKQKGTTTTIVGSVIMVESKGKTGIVPLSNVRSALVAPEEPKAKK